MIDVFQIENLITLLVTAKEIQEEIKHYAILLKIQQTLEKGKSLVQAWPRGRPRSTRGEEHAFSRYRRWI